MGGGLLARWQTNWDCGYETQWWYCIKDTKFDIDTLKSKHRYEINKGNKNFTVEKVDPEKYHDELFRVTEAAYSGWPEKYRPSLQREGFTKQVTGWKNADVFSGFHVETGELQGYAVCFDHDSYVDFSVLRVDPAAEKSAINAAIIASILEFYKDRFDGKFYICDGSRTVRHETAFQDYLEKYFGFRKAYCRLNIEYRHGFGRIISLLYPFRKRIPTDSKFGSKLAGIMKMEEIRRSF